MKRAIAILFLISSTASTQPITKTGSLAANGNITATGTISQASHQVVSLASGALTISGATVSMLGCGSSGQVWIWNGSAFACGSAGITNAAAANAITKSDGTNIVASSATDDGTTFKIASTKVQVTEANGNTTIAGTLGVTGALTAGGVTDGANRVYSTHGTGLTSSTATEIDLSLAGASCLAGNFMTALSSTGTGTCAAASGTIGGLTSGKVPVASSGTSLTNGWPTDNGTTWGVGGTYTIDEATGNVATAGKFEAGNSLLMDNGVLELAGAGDEFVFASAGVSSGNQNLNLDAAGTGIVRINSNTGGIANAGTGGLIVYGGAGGSTPEVTLSAAGSIVTTGSITSGAGLTVSNSGLTINSGGVTQGIGSTTAGYTMTDALTGRTATVEMISVSDSGASYDTTSGALVSYGIKSSIASTRSTGASNLLNVAGYFNAIGATVNEALETDNGNVLLNQVSGSTTIGAVGANAQYTLLAHQVITSSGTYTPTTGTRAVHVYMCGGGGGGGGGGAASASGVGGGGGTGASVDFWIQNATITGGTATIGTAGSAGSAGAGGGTGGDSSVVIQAVTYTAKGGTGGGGDTGVTTAATAGGGPQSGSTVPTGGQIGGANGASGILLASSTGASGAGGSLPVGVGGIAQVANNAGFTAAGKCSGGGGALGLLNAKAGGAGTAGLILVDDYL